MNNDEIRDMIDNEGLDYAIMYYTNGEEFEDTKVKELWDKAGKALKELSDYLKLEDY